MEGGNVKAAREVRAASPKGAPSSRSALAEVQALLEEGRRRPA